MLPDSDNADGIVCPDGWTPLGMTGGCDWLRASPVWELPLLVLFSPDRRRARMATPDAYTALLGCCYTYAFGAILGPAGRDPIFAASVRLALALHDEGWSWEALGFLATYDSRALTELFRFVDRGNLYREPSP